MSGWKAVDYAQYTALAVTQVRSKHIQRLRMWLSSRNLGTTLLINKSGDGKLTGILSGNGVGGDGKSVK